MAMIKHFLAVSICVFALAACDGGGSGLSWADGVPLLKNQEIETSGKINLNWRF